MLLGTGLCVGLQRSPNACGVSECDHETSIMKGPWTARGCCAVEIDKANKAKCWC